MRANPGGTIGLTETAGRDIRIKPTPPIQVVFEELRGMIIAKISVARGEAPLYMTDGVVYLRQGSADVQAQPDDLTRLVAEFAF